MSITRELLEKINGEELLAELGFSIKKASAQYIRFNCPSCHKDEAYYYRESHTLQCSRLNECQWETTVWDYLQSQMGLSPQQTLAKLAQLAGVQLDSKTKATAHEQTEQQPTPDLDHLNQIFMKSLDSLEGKSVRNYLQNRGYQPEEIQAMELGFFPPASTLQNQLGFTDHPAQFLERVGLNQKSLGSTHTLTIPYKNLWGKIQGFAIRRIDSNPDFKYLYNTGLKKDHPFLAYTIQGKHVVLVEGLFDALVATVRSRPQSQYAYVAIGQARLSHIQLQSIVRKKPRSLILALDQDEAGKSGTEKAISLISTTEIPCYVLDYPQAYKDLDEYLQEHSISDLEQQLRKVSHAIQWQINALRQRYHLENAKERDEFITTALEFGAHLTNPIQMDEFFHSTSEPLTAYGIRRESLQPRFYRQQQQALERIETQRIRTAKTSFFQEYGSLIEQGRYDQFLKLLEQAKLSFSSVRQGLTPYNPDHLLSDLQQAKENLKTGYPSLDRWFRIQPETLTIFAGRPSHGKTTLLLNLFLKLIELYPHKHFFFFSYEQTKLQLAIRAITILKGDPEDNLSYHEIKQYLKHERSGHIALDYAIESYRQFTAEQRLWIIDEPYPIYPSLQTEKPQAGLKSIIQQLAQQYDIGAIFVDYIQKINLGGEERPLMRQMELQRVSAELLQLALDQRLPILLGAQFNREVKTLDQLSLDSIREAGDIEQDANLVLGLWNHAFDGSARNPNHPAPNQLTVKILKNRDGEANRNIKLQFNPNQLLISEREQDS